MLIDDIALTLEPGLNPAAVIRLMEVFGSAEAIYAASAGEMEERAELKPELARSIIRRQSHRKAEQEMQFMARNGISAVVSTAEEYPTMLRECNDYPHVLYIKGDPAVLSAPMLSMVGTRNINTYGLSVCNRLVEGLAKLMPQLVIVSGLAFGADVACHRAAIGNGLRTVGVMANPLNSVYPSAHRGVAEDMVRRGGAVVSELSSQDTVNKARFLQRNRIIAAMSPGTVVVQSPLSGGSMITASLVDGYNHCLMCPPANIGEELSEGTNLLLRKLKARMVCSAADILEELGWEAITAPPNERSAGAKPEDPKQKAVYDLICAQGRISLEEIEAATGIAMRELLGIMMELEFAGYVRLMPGNNYEKFK